jgi:hypothetical protein
MGPRIIATTVALGVMVTVAVAGISHAVGSAESGPQTSTGWVRTITNPYLPYTPGSRWVYKGMKDGVTQTDVVEATHRTRVIAGVRTTIVRDVATHNGRILEATTDYYAQDASGNVWYFGEATKAFGPGGQVDTSGSWLAEVNGARQGIFMTAHPAVEDAHRQEFAPGNAEDQYWLVALHHGVSVPAVTSNRAALTIEWSRLEPTVIDEKSYVPGIGPVREIAVQGPTEDANLVKFTHSAGSQAG